MVNEYRKRRDILVDGLNKIPGIHCQVPLGAFYTFPNITALCDRSLGHQSDWLADFILERAGVALLPGTSFGHYGEGYLRLCFANSEERIITAIERIGNALAALG